MLRWRFKGNPSAAGASKPWEKPFDPKTNIEDIYFCYRLLLGRNPNAYEVSAGHLTARVGDDLSNAVKLYLQSEEFARRGLLRQDHSSEVSVTELDGFNIYSANNDMLIGRALRAGSYEPHITALFRQLLRPGMGVIDLGANIGYFTMLAARLVGTAGYVLAIEPNRQNVKLLEASRRFNKFDQVHVAQMAASSQLGILALHIFHSNGTTSNLDGDLDTLLGSETVPCVAVDNLVPPDRRIDLIKIDVEGAEYDALQGCKQILTANRPVIISEFSPGFLQSVSKVDGATYLKWLLGWGYMLSIIQPDGSLLNVQNDWKRIIAAHEERCAGHIDILAQIPVRSI